MVPIYHTLIYVAPSRVRELKQNEDYAPLAYPLVAPSRVRELKLDGELTEKQIARRTLTGA